MWSEEPSEYKCECPWNARAWRNTKDYQYEYCMRCNSIKAYRLMNRSNHTFPVSRDWEDIDCKATGCLYNVREKCATPSRCKIGDMGECTGFEVKPFNPKQVDGD